MAWKASEKDERGVKSWEKTLCVWGETSHDCRRAGHIIEKCTWNTSFPSHTYSTLIWCSLSLYISHKHPSQKGTFIQRQKSLSPSSSLYTQIDIRRDPLCFHTTNGHILHMQKFQQKVSIARFCKSKNIYRNRLFIFRYCHILIATKWHIRWVPKLSR